MHDLPPGECGGLLVDAGNGRGSAAPPPRLAVDGADEVAPVVLIHVALTVRPPPANVGLGLESKKIIFRKNYTNF